MVDGESDKFEVVGSLPASPTKNSSRYPRIVENR